MNNKQRSKSRVRLQENNKRGKKQKSKKKKRFSFLSFLLGLLLIFIILFTMGFGYYFVKEGFDAEKALASLKNKILLKPEKITVLVLGVSTDISTELTDTIMVCSYNPGSQSAFILSIPRDTFIGDDENNAKGRDKINALYTREGPEAVINKVEKITNLDIDYYVVVKNDALIDIVNSIGSVEFDVPIDMDYDDITQDLHIHLKSGVQKIDGEKAEQLLRFRHNNDGSSYPASYGDNDLGRMRTQRNFMMETAKQTISFKNIFKIPFIASAIMKNVDTNMTMGTGMKYVPSALNFDISSVETYVLPGEAKKLNSLWFYDYSISRTKNLIDELNEKME